MADCAGLVTLFRVAGGGKVAAFAGAGGEEGGDAGGGVGFAELVGEVLLVGVFEQAFVVEEEDVGGDGDDLACAVFGDGGVVELHALVAELRVDGGGIFFDGGLEDAVELASAGDFAGFVADAQGLFEDLLDGFVFFGGDDDEGGVVEEK